MLLTDAEKNDLLSIIGSPTQGATFGSLHSAFSPTGANELSGGSPAYSRVPLSWSAPAAGSLSLSALPTWNVASGSTVSFKAVTVDGSRTYQSRSAPLSASFVWSVP